MLAATAVLFDLYGTLVELEIDERSSSLWRSFSAFVARKGLYLNPDELRLRFETLRDREVASSGDGSAMEAVFKALLPADSPHGSAGDIAEIASYFRLLSIVSLDLRPYTKPLMSTLRGRGLKIGLVSNTEALFTRFDLRQTCLELEFDAIVLSSDVGLKKPDPRVFELALAQLDAKPDVTIFVGDNIRDDIQGAQRAGLKGIYVNRDGDNFDRSILAHEPQVIGVMPAYDDILLAIDALRGGAK